MPTNFEEKTGISLKAATQIINLLRHNTNIILYGPPGTGKTYTAKAVALYKVGREETFNDNNDWRKKLEDYEKYGRISIVQFHPSYNYDDFVIGIEARTEKDQVVFKKVPRTLVEMSRKALVRMVLPEMFEEYIGGDEKKKEEIYDKARKEWLDASEDDKKKMKENAPPFVLIIDEINRANLPAVLGELIYALEYRGEEVNIMYGEKLIIPPNLYIIGTMNTADRSAGRIDYAIRRRFTFYPMHADDSEAENEYGKPLMKAVNKFIENNISPEYDPEDIKIGHTYFMSKKETDEEKKEEIAYKFLYQVVPLLYEYIKDGLIRAEREEGKGYKVELSIEHGTVEKKEKTYYLRGGRLYDGENIVTLEKVKEFLGKQGSNNSGQNANSKQEKSKEPPQSETTS